MNADEHGYNIFAKMPKAKKSFYLCLSALTCMDSTNVAGARMRRSDHLWINFFTIKL
jgi:hypothetical protein